MDINEEIWQQICEQTAREMLDHTKPFVTPISEIISDDEGALHGSGSYIENNGMKYLITNEHVARRMKIRSLAHQFLNSDNIIRVTNQFSVDPQPIDVAISHIPDNVWNICEHDSLAIPASRFALRHLPANRELLFLIGFSGERSKFLFGTLFSPGTPYLSQEIEPPSKLGQTEFHFALEYKPDLAWRIDGSTRGLPTPPGLSGSLVWNTRRVECLQNRQDWTPNLATVTGIIWGWPSSEAYIIATRIEHINISELIKSQ